jgi:hypothetical protein
MSAISKTPAPVSPARYEAIVAHAELELELAGRGELEQLMSLGERWEELVAGLPETPPPDAASLLVRAKLMHERTAIELIRLREGLMADFNVTTQAKRAAAGYGGQLGHRPLPRLSRRGGGRRGARSP